MKKERHAEFWERVQGHLDARADPLEDPRVEGHLLEHPDCLEEFAELLASLDAVTRSTALVGARQWSGWRWAATVAAAVLALLAGVLLLPRGGSRDRPEPAPPVTDAGRIIEYRITVATQGVGERTETVADPSGWLASRSIQFDEPGRGDTAFRGITQVQVHNRGSH